jgi:hypothetical protein
MEGKVRSSSGDMMEEIVVTVDAFKYFLVFWKTSYVEKQTAKESIINLWR